MLAIRMQFHSILFSFCFVAYCSSVRCCVSIIHPSTQEKTTNETKQLKVRDEHSIKSRKGYRRPPIKEIKMKHIFFLFFVEHLDFRASTDIQTKDKKSLMISGLHFFWFILSVVVVFGSTTGGKLEISLRVRGNARGTPKSIFDFWVFFIICRENITKKQGKKNGK